MCGNLCHIWVYWVAETLFVLGSFVYRRASNFAVRLTRDVIRLELFQEIFPGEVLDRMMPIIGGVAGQSWLDRLARQAKNRQRYVAAMPRRGHRAAPSY
jgi:hypothetical protein